jgi:hyperosmotically inducible protein
MKSIFRSILPYAAIIATSAGLIGCAATRTSESTGQYLDDTTLTAKVKTAIFEQPSLKSAEINVETFKGVVQLSGFVSTQANVNTAVATAMNVKGVMSVKNDMRLK